MSKVHGSIAPKSDTPLVALVDIDEPNDMTGKVALKMAGKTLQAFEVVVEGGSVTEVTADTPPSDPRQGTMTVAFRGNDAEEEVLVFNMTPAAKDFMSIRPGLAIEVSSLGETFESQKGSAWLNEITSEFALEIARKKFTKIPLTLTNQKQFPRKDLPLPEEGESIELAQCGTRFSRVGDKLAANHNPKESFVSRQLIESGDQAKIADLQKHEQVHMNITSALVAIGKVYVDAAGAGKTGADLKQAREDAADTALQIIGAADGRSHIRYDDETDHGLVATKQKHWETNFIDEVMVEWLKESDSEFKAR